MFHSPHTRPHLNLGAEGARLLGGWPEALSNPLFSKLVKGFLIALLDRNDTPLLEANSWFCPLGICNSLGLFFFPLASLDEERGVLVGAACFYI